MEKSLKLAIAGVCIIVFLSVFFIYNKSHLFGVGLGKIDQIQVIHNYKSFQLKLSKQKEYKFLKSVEGIFLNNSNKISITGLSANISPEEVIQYANNDSENHFIFIKFKSPQKVKIKNKSDQKIKDCDALLFDLEEGIIHWSKNGKFLSSLKYFGDFKTDLQIDKYKDIIN